jgi:hypothetical protein
VDEGVYGRTRARGVGIGGAVRRVVGLLLGLVLWVLIWLGMLWSRPPWR